MITRELLMTVQDGDMLEVYRRLGERTRERAEGREPQEPGCPDVPANRAWPERM